MKKTLLLTLALIAVGCAEPDDDMTVREGLQNVSENLDGVGVWVGDMLDKIEVGDFLELTLGQAALLLFVALFVLSSVMKLLSDIYRDARVRLRGAEWAEEDHERAEAFKREKVDERYYKNGELKSRTTYKNGKQNGLGEVYSEDGQLSLRMNYKDDKIHGLYEAFWDNGEVSLRITHKEGLYHGPYESYQTDGQISLKGNYSMGEKCGEWLEDGETVTYNPCPPDLEGGS